MSSYKKSIIFCSFLLFFSGCGFKTLNNEKSNVAETTFTKVKIKPYNLENQYIILALESENQRMYGDSVNLYLNLFENTNNYEYLVK